MDRRLRRAPDAEWVLMYRLGLSRKRIAALAGVAPATVGYHLAIARRQDRRLEVEHKSAASSVPYPSPKDRVRMEGVVAWIEAQSRLPDARSANKGERSMAHWLSARRREAADGGLDPVYRCGLARVPGWDETRRMAEDEDRWQLRLAQLVGFRQEGNDWPRHHAYDSEQEHLLGVWLHTQRYKHRRGDLNALKVKLLDDAVPGWQVGRTRGRPPRR